MCDNKIGCASDRIFSISAKSSDLNFCQFRNKESDGYSPLVKNICGGDYVEFSACLECGKIQGKFPVEDPDMD